MLLKCSSLRLLIIKSLLKYGCNNNNLLKTLIKFNENKFNTNEINVILFAIIAFNWLTNFIISIGWLCLIVFLYLNNCCTIHKHIFNEWLNVWYKQFKIYPININNIRFNIKFMNKNQSNKNEINVV